MEDNPSPFLQTRAVFELLRGIKWKDLFGVDFRVIRPIPFLNKLEKELILPIQYEGYMREKTEELINMWHDHTHHNLSPWQVKGEIYQEDINALDILNKIQHDSEKLKQDVKEVKQAEQKYISDSLIQGFKNVK